MLEEILHHFYVYLSSALKFIIGPTLGTYYGFNVFVTGTLTALGMMTSVYTFTYFGTRIRRASRKFWNAKNKKIFTKKNRRFVRIWLNYGVPGIAMLTPVLLMPIGGTIIVNAFGGKKQEIIKWMWISCVFWSYSITWVIKYASHLLPALGF